MRYPNGEEVRPGDKIRIGVKDTGWVVAVPEKHLFSERFPKEDWGYLTKGLLVLSENAGVVHYEEMDSEMTLFHRDGASDYMR